MKLLLTFLVTLISTFIFSQKIMSWNIQNLGPSKFSKKDIMCGIVDVIESSDCDIIAIQELVVSKWADSCMTFIASELGYKYVLSQKTKGVNGRTTEKFAYLYNPSTVEVINHYLDKNLENVIEREPYVGVFKYKKNNKYITLRQVHIVPSSKNPIYEIRSLPYCDGIILGDFNLTDEHIGYIPLLIKYKSPLKGKKTSLKRNGTLNKSYDHFLIDNDIDIVEEESMVYLYEIPDGTLTRNKLSDHLPIIIKLL